VDLIEMTSSVDESLSRIEPAPQRPGMVARLMELKKRRAQMASGKFFHLFFLTYSYFFRQSRKQLKSIEIFFFFFLVATFFNVEDSATLKGTLKIREFRGISMR
jgi:hypothetical protein